MFRSGFEEPVVNNQSLYMKIDGCDELVTDRSAGLKLNRYTFVLKEDNPHEWANLFQTIIRELRAKTYGLACWRANEPEGSGVPSRLRERTFVKKAWQIESRNSYLVAYKALDDEDCSTWPPALADSSKLGFLVLLVSDLDGSVVNLVPVDVLSFMAWSHYLAPSFDFLKNLEVKKATLIYAVEHELGYQAIVVVTPWRLDIERVRLSVNIGTLLGGDSASQVLVRA